MRKFVKAAVAVGACLVLTGCPKATTVNGLVTGGIVGLGHRTIQTGDTLTPTLTYSVEDGASITVTYDNGKTCTFNGPTTFLPGADGSVCEKQDNDDKKQDDKDQKQEQQEQEQQEQEQQEQGQQEQPDAGQGQEQGQAPSGGTNPGSGINAPEVTPTSVPDYSGIGGPQVIATGVPTYSRIMSVIDNPILTSTLAVIGAATVVKEVHDQTNGDGDEPVSK